jgi:uncharacterized repeat protein (TIGR03943 family)
MDLNLHDLTQDAHVTLDTRTDRRAWMEWAKAGVTLGLAGYFAVLILAEDLTNYINTRFEWLSWVALALFLVLGLATLSGLLRKEATSVTSDHTMISWPTLMIMAIPLLMGTLIPSQPLGANAAQGDIGLTTAAFNVGSAVNKDPLDRNVLDWLRVFAGTDTPAEFDGTPAEFVGFIYHAPDMPDDHFMVARMTVSCCVADASGVGIPVHFPGSADLIAQALDTQADNRDLWVRVEGAFEAEVFRDTKTPVLQATGVEVVSEPDHPYLYP